MKPSNKALDGAVSAYLCNFFLDENGVKTLKVLKKAGLEHADLHSADAVNALYMSSQLYMPQTLHTRKDGNPLVDGRLTVRRMRRRRLDC